MKGRKDKEGQLGWEGGHRHRWRILAIPNFGAGEDARDSYIVEQS